MFVEFHFENDAHKTDGGTEGHRASPGKRRFLPWGIQQLAACTCHSSQTDLISGHFASWDHVGRLPQCAELRTVAAGSRVERQANAKTRSPPIARKKKMALSIVVMISIQRVYGIGEHAQGRSACRKARSAFGRGCRHDRPDGARVYCYRVGQDWHRRLGNPLEKQRRAEAKVRFLPAKNDLNLAIWVVKCRCNRPFQS